MLHIAQFDQEFFDKVLIEILIIDQIIYQKQIYARLLNLINNCC